MKGRRRILSGGLGIHHDLKEWAEYFGDLWTRDRSHEVRRDDRPVPFDRGQTVRISEYADHECTMPTGRWVRGSITHVTRGPVGSNAEIAPGLCVFSFYEHARGGDDQTKSADSVDTPLDRKAPGA